MRSVITSLLVFVSLGLYAHNDTHTPKKETKIEQQPTTNQNTQKVKVHVFNIFDLGIKQQQTAKPDSSSTSNSPSLINFFKQRMNIMFQDDRL